MGKIIEFKDKELGTIYIEIEENKEGFRNISNIGDKIEGKFSQALQSLETFGKGVLTTVQSLKPDEVEVKAGLKFEIKEGKLIGIFAQAKAEFPFEVTLKWKFDEKNKTEKPTT